MLVGVGGQDALRLFRVLFTLRSVVEASVNVERHQPVVVLVGQRVEALTTHALALGVDNVSLLPVHARHLERPRKVSHHRGIALKVLTQLLAHLSVVGTSSELNEASSLEARTVARPRVAQILTSIVGFARGILSGNLVAGALD